MTVDVDGAGVAMGGDALLDPGAFYPVLHSRPGDGHSAGVGDTLPAAAVVVAAENSSLCLLPTGGICTSVGTETAAEIVAEALPPIPLWLVARVGASYGSDG